MVHTILTENSSDTDEFKDDKTTGASYANLNSKIGMTMAGVELAEDPSGPGLDVLLKGLKIVWDPVIRISAHIDILDVFLIAYAGTYVADTVREIRKAIAIGGEDSSGVDLLACIEFKGSINFSIGVAVRTFKISPLLNSSDKSGRVKPDFSSGGKVEGEGKVGISLKAESFFLSFETSVEGALVTSFIFQVSDSGSGPQCKKGFEGLFLKFRAHVKGGAATRKPNSNKDKKVKGDDTSVTGTLGKHEGTFTVIEPKIVEGAFKI
jgi:hypothetical protein